MLTEKKTEGKNGINMTFFKVFNEKVITPILGLYKGKIGDLAYYMAFVAVFLFRMYYSSMFPLIMEKPLFLAFPYYIGLFLLVTLSGLGIIDAFFKSRREAVFLVCILLSVAINAVTLKHFDYLLPFFLLVLASRNRNIRPVFVLYTILCSAFLIIAYYASMNGYIPYLVYDRGNEGLLSHAFGMNYRTTLAGYVFCIIVCYTIIRAEKMHLWEYLMLWFDGWLIWRYTMSRTACFCMVLFLSVVGIILAYYHIHGKWIEIPKWSALIHVVSAVVSFAVVALWSVIGNDSIIIPEGGDSLISRFTLSIQAFQMYPVNLFGNLVKERSAGGIVDTSEPYFYLDIIYVRILFIGGVILFILYLCLMTMASLKAIEEKQIILAVALIIIGLDGIVESHFLTLSFNVFILYSLGYLSPKKQIE